jgi:ribosomal 50S subunit-associated protein YjgA (DUF615 family)
MAKVKVMYTANDVKRLFDELVQLERDRLESITVTQRINQAITEKRREHARASRGRIDVSGLKQEDLFEPSPREDGLHEPVDGDV